MRGPWASAPVASYSLAPAVAWGASAVSGATEEERTINGAKALHRSGVVATFMFILILTWSEYLMALILSATNISTMPVQLSKYEGATGGRLYGWQQAMSIGVILPLIVIGYAIHRHLVRGFSFGMLNKVGRWPRSGW